MTYDHEAKDSYSVTVKADDGNGGSDTVPVTITVTDVNEQPATPTAPSVTAPENTTDSLDVGWTAPGLNGGPALTGYEVQYRKGSGSWSAWTHSGTGTTATITPLDASSEYQVQVRALNGETPSDWSPHGTGTTGTPNSAPVFANASETRSVAENTAAGENVGAVVTATDANSDTLEYSLEGTDAASFDIDSTSGQIQTKSGVTYDHEAKDSYSVTVKADDGNGGSDTVPVTITVTDVAEQPATPTAPSVTAPENTTDSLDVGWTAPGLNGGPALTGYEVQYRKGSGSWSAWTHSGTGTTATITPLDASSEYQVQVRALNGETPSDWSPHGTGTTGTPNSAPVFANAAETRSVAENTAAGENVGAVVTATDANSDTLEYSLEGTDAASFDIDSTSGQIQTKSGVTYDHEAKSSYSVTVKADDGNGGSDMVPVTITVTDVNEQPATPTAPSVTAPENTTDSLDVGWTAPGLNGGPALTGYEVQYRKGSGSWSAWTHSGTGTTATIAPLDASTSYQVRVRALNGETPSDWSPHGTGTTGTPNSAPVFANASETRSVAENTAAGENVGAVVTATDANSDTLEYSLEGTDAASFDIDSTSGQIQTKSGVTYDHEAKDSYSVTVKADDGNGGSDTVPVTITVTDVAEQPATPTAPSVTAPENTTDSLDVGWTAPGLNGGPALTGYEVQYRKGMGGPWSAWAPSGTGTTATIAPLDASTSYQVRVRALNGETPSDASPPGTGTTGVPALPGLSIADGSASEGAGTMAFAVTLSEAGSAQVTVAYATSGGSATQGMDYTAASGTLTFAPGDTAETISVPLTDDTLVEGDETFQVTLSAPQQATLADATATGTITDNDQASTALLLSLDPDRVTEGGGARSITVTVTLDAGARPVPTNVVVTLNSQEAGFGPGQDAAVVEPFTITIEPGRTSASRSFTFRPRDDALAEGTESIEVRGEAVGLRVESATLELTDNDTATVNLSVPYRARHSEGGGATFVPVVGMLNSVRSADTVVTVQVRGSGRSGVSGFEAVEPFELTIPAGERRGDEDGFMLYPQNDEEAEGDETLTISGRASGLRVTSATFLLEDDDSETASTKVTLALSETRLAESEGKHFDLTVTGTLDGAARQQDTVVTLTPTNRQSDGSEVSALVDSGMRLTIRAGRISGRRTFGITLRTPGIDQADGELTLGGTADELTVEPARLELLDGDDAPDLITLTLSETRVPEDWRGTVRVLADMTPSARAEDTVVTLSVRGTGATGAVDFNPVRDFKLTIPKGWEAYGAKFVLLTEQDGAPGPDETLTVSGTTDVAGLQVRPATMVLVEGDGPEALNFAHFANGGSITSEMVLVNAAPQPSRPAIYFYDTKGDPIPAESVVDLTGDLEVTEDGALTVWTEMEPLAELTISTHGRGEPVSGSVTVRSDGPISGVLRYSVPEIGVAEVGVGQPLRDALFPARRQAGGIRTAAALHNLGEEAMGVSCRLMSGGVVLEEVEIPLEAKGQTSWFIEDAFTTTDTSDFLGSVRCTASGEGLFTAVALEMDPGNRIFNALSVVPVDHTGGRGGETVLNFAHIVNGTWITDLVFVNLSTEASRPAIYFYDTEGNPIAAESVVDITGDLEITEDGALTVQTEMEPLGVLTISTHGRGELLSGSARVVSDGPIGGMLRFEHPDFGVAGVGASLPVSDAVFPVRRQEGGITTGVALHNLESSPGLLRCDLMREGVLLDAASIPLEANGQTSWLIDQAFPAADTSDFAGSVRCDAVGEGLFSAVALEMDPGSRIFVTLPVVPVPEMSDRE